MAATLLVPALAAFLLAAWGRNVLLIVPHSPEAVEINRSLWVAGDDVVPLYGNPMGQSVRILFAHPSRVVVPPEDPALVLYRVDKQKGENPLQEQTVWYFAGILQAAVLAGVAFLSLLGGLLRGR